MKRWIARGNAAKPIPEKVATQAAQLRRLAEEAERGLVKYLVVTVVRPDGRVERLGDTEAPLSP